MKQKKKVAAAAGEGDAQQEMRDALNAFLDKLQDEDYLAQFLLTLEINKVEAAHQKNDQPMIFLKDLDENGVVQEFTMNPVYSGKGVPEPKTIITGDEVRILADHLSTEEMMAKLSVMITSGNLEQVFFSGMSRGELETSTPLLGKEFDSFGIPVAYKMNWPVELVTVDE